MTNMKPGRACVELVERFEGLRLTAYQDCVGVWTIGYGHTGRGVGAGMTITQEMAEELLVQDMAAASVCVNAHVTATLSQNQFDALVDFTFNLGNGALLTSTLLRKVNASDYVQAAAEFAHWDHAGGRVVEGLTLRRAAETALFQRS